MSSLKETAPWSLLAKVKFYSVKSGQSKHSLSFQLEEDLMINPMYGHHLETSSNIAPGIFCDDCQTCNPARRSIQNRMKALNVQM